MRCLAPALCAVLTFGSAPRLGTAQQPVTRLNIVVVEGEGAINNVRQRTARETIVQVEDQNRRPVAGAAVVFMLPEQGASGVFPNGARSVTMVTDQKGQAVMKGMRPNNVAGQMQMRVTASYQGQTATTTITQTNVLGAAAAGAGGISGKLLAILGIAGAAVAGGVVAATRGNGSTSPATRPPTTITPGASTVGPPR